MSDFLSLVLQPIDTPVTYSLTPQTQTQTGPIPHPPFRQQKHPDLLRDQRRDVQLLHNIGWSYSQIHRHTSHSIRQIRTAYQKATPCKRSGRPPILTQAQIEDLVEFVCASATNRRMSYQKLSEVIEFGVKKQTIRSALLREGFHRRLAMRKPPITEKNRVLRLAWAHEHLD